jgi:hypothetical protein
MKILIILFLLGTTSSCAFREQASKIDNSFLLGTIIGTLLSLR